MPKLESCDYVIMGMSPCFVIFVWQGLIDCIVGEDVHLSCDHQLASRFIVWCEPVKPIEREYIEIVGVTPCIRRSAPGYEVQFW